MRAGWASISIVLLFFGLNSAASAEKRVALVIGNSGYLNVGRLVNPANDSAAISDTFKSSGFDIVELKRDLKANEMRRALRDFSDSVRDADVAIVYYAGHGIEIDGTNYLIPTDATLERDIDAYDEAVPLDRLLTVIEPARKLRLVILDACRDNPFSKTMKRTIGSRAIGRGLAKVDPTSPNTLVAFAAKAGSTASDGDGKNSPFTAALVKYLPKPGLDLRKAFGFARDDVLKVTGNRQEPFIYGSLGGEDFSLVAAPAPAPAVVPDSSQAIRTDYELAERVGTKEAWDFFLSTYPGGFYAKLAQAQRNKLEAEQSRLAAVEKSRAAEEDRARLTAEGARASSQAKAAAEARAAEEARAAAERKKALEETKIAEVERAQAKAAEDARLAAERKKEIEQAKAAEAEHERLVLQAKAAADARLAAENARAAAEAEVKREQIALERAKALAEEKAAEAARIKAEARVRAEQDAKAAASKTKATEEARANLDAELARQQKVAQEARLAEAERGRLAAQVKANEASTKAVTADDAVRDQKPIGPLANLTPPNDQGASAPGQESLPRLLQAQLRRVGCSSDPVTGDWDASAQKALHLFNKNAGTKFDVRVASIDALDVVRGKTGRICPLLCEHGFKADGDSCVKIICKDGLELSDDNSCERVERQKPRRKETPTATLTPERSTSPSSERQSEPAAASSAPRRAALGGYRQCMGALPGCYERAIRNRSPEAARAWCNRRPTC
jgi:uncharacterized caspase-like protein